MKRFLLCCGTHGRPESLERLSEALTERHADGVLFAGGIVDPARRCATKETPWSLAKEDALYVREFFAVLGRLGVFSAVIPGPAGAPVDEFLRLGMAAELEYPHVWVAQATLIEEKDLAVCGIGGVVAEDRLLGMDSVCRTEAEYALRPLLWSERPHKVMLLPAPPPGPLGGPEGVPLIAELIDSLHPDLCLVAGSSDRQGARRVGHTLVVNPGCLADGKAAWLDWDRPAEEQVEFLTLPDVLPGNPAGRAVPAG
jgi:hypothetical protein